MSDDPLVPAAPPLHIPDSRREGFAFLTWRDALVDAFEGVDRAYERRQQMVQAAYDAGVSFRAIGEAVGRSRHPRWKHDGGLWELAFAAGRGAERERIVAALEADYRANVADGADGIYTDGLHDAWRLTVRRAKRDDLIKPVSGSSEPRKETT